MKKICLLLFVFELSFFSFFATLASSACGPDTKFPVSSKYRTPKKLSYSNGILKVEGFELKFLKSQDEFEDEYKGGSDVARKHIKIFDCLDKCRAIVIFETDFAAAPIDIWLVDYINKRSVYSLKSPGPNLEITWYGHSYLEILSRQNTDETSYYYKIPEKGSPLKLKGNLLKDGFAPARTDQN